MKHGGRQPGRALRYAEGSARGLLHHPVGHYLLRVDEVRDFIIGTEGAD